MFRRSFYGLCNVLSFDNVQHLHTHLEHLTFQTSKNLKLEHWKVQLCAEEAEHLQQFAVERWPGSQFQRRRKFGSWERSRHKMVAERKGLSATPLHSRCFSLLAHREFMRITMLSICMYNVIYILHIPWQVGLCHHGMARPQVACGGTASRYGG